MTETPQRLVFRPEGPISRRVWSSRSCTGFPGAHAPGSAETGPSGLGWVGGASESGAYAPGFAEIGPSGLGGRVGPGASAWFIFCLRLRFRPEGPLSGSPGRSHSHEPFCRGHCSNECAAQQTPNGPTARHNLASGNARGTRIKAPKAVPEFTANAFADHHRRIRLASLCEPKTMTSLRCRGGMPSTTPPIMGNDKAHRARPSPPQPHFNFAYFVVQKQSLPSPPPPLRSVAFGSMARSLVPRSLRIAPTRLRSARLLCAHC